MGVAEAFLVGTIVIWVDRVPGLLAGIQKDIGQRMLFIGRGDI